MCEVFFFYRVNIDLIFLFLRSVCLLLFYIKKGIYIVDY